jgi:hypothetical protein
MGWTIDNFDTHRERPKREGNIPYYMWERPRWDGKGPYDVGQTIDNFHAQRERPNI